MSRPTRILVALPRVPAEWHARTVAALREAGARVRTVRVDAPPCPGPGLLAAPLFALERLWSSSKPTGTRPASAPISDDPDDGAHDIRLSLCGDSVFDTHTPPGGDWHIGFPDTHDPVAAARRAVLSGAASLTATLHRRAADGARALRESTAGVSPFSAADTLRTLTALAAALPARELVRPRARPATTPSAATTPPPAVAALRHLGRLLAEARRDACGRKQWYLLLGPTPANTPLPDPRALTPEYPPRDRIHADPFVHEDGETCWVFFEEMLFAENKGRIAAGRLSDGRLCDIRTVLSTDHHLSYPQVFLLDGKRVLTVESARAGHVRLFDCEDFPDRWTAGPVIFDGPMIDPSLIEHEGRHWLFGNLPPGPHARADAELHVFFTDNPRAGRWTPHPLNPVISDATCARGAGRPFVRDGKLYRPAQDCAGGYGRRVILREITTLTPESYEERTVGDIPPEPLPGAIALHTLNSGTRTVALDAARRI